MPDIRIREIDTTNGLEYAENDFIVFAPIQVTSVSTLEEKLYNNAEDFKKDYENDIADNNLVEKQDLKDDAVIDEQQIYTFEDLGKFVEVANSQSEPSYYEGYETLLKEVVKRQDEITGTYSYVLADNATYWVTETEPAAVSGKIIWKHTVGSKTKYTRFLNVYEASTAFNYIYKLLELGMTFFVVPFKDIAALTYDDFFEQYTDLGKYNFGFISLAGLTGTQIAQDAIKCAAQRGDAAALIDVPSMSGTDVASIIEFMQQLVVSKIVRGDMEDPDFFTEESAYKYAFLFSPDMTIENKLDVIYPTSFDYLACFAKSITRFPAYFAIAGKERGKAPFENVQPNVIYGDLDVNKLQVRKPRSGEETSKCCNVIYNCRPFGFVMWGNRTLEPVGLDGLKASHFANIRILCNILKKALYRAAKKYTFEPNSDVLWANFTNELTPLLDEMRSSQGIRGYKFIKEATNEKAKLKARIKIIPIEAVEDFDLTVELTDSIEVTE